jgi:hypothetical protein
MKRRKLLATFCLDCCSCFNQYATDLRMPCSCSGKEGRILNDLCINYCSCFQQYAMDLDVSPESSEMEGRGPRLIPDIHIRSSRQQSATLLSTTDTRALNTDPRPCIWR